VTYFGEEHANEAARAVGNAGQEEGVGGEHDHRALRTTTQHDTAQNSTAENSLAQHGMARDGTAQHGPPGEEGARRGRQGGQGFGLKAWE